MLTKLWIVYPGKVDDESDVDDDVVSVNRPTR